MVLSENVIIGQRYALESVLGSPGPIDISYLALETATQKHVVVREYFPISLARRAEDGREVVPQDAELFTYGHAVFAQEIERLQAVFHPNIVDRLHAVHEHGTVYRISDFVAGVTLANYVAERGGRLSQDEALGLLVPLLEGLDVCHQAGLAYGTVAPQTILIAETGQPVLHHFQAARLQLAQLTGEVNDLRVRGYAPPELLNADVEAGPWWDIYGCAATLFFMLTGMALPQVNNKGQHARMLEVLKGSPFVSRPLCAVLARALSFSGADRPATAGALLAECMDAVFGDGLTELPDLAFDFPTLPAPDDRPSRKPAAALAEPSPAAGETYLSTLSNWGRRGRNRTDRAMKKRSSSPAGDVPSRSSDRAVAPTGNRLVAHAASDDGSRRPANPVWLVVSVLALLFLAVATAFALDRDMAANGRAILASLFGSAEAPSVPTPAEAAPAPVEAAPAPVEAAPAPAEAAPAPAEAASPTAPRSPATEPAASAPAPVPQPTVVVAAAPPPATASVTAPPPQAEPAAPATPPVAMPAPVNADSLAEALEAESQYQYLRGQGDVLFRLGNLEEALARYESAATFRPDDAYLTGRIAAVRDSLDVIAATEARLEAQKALRASVTDENGVFIRPDAPAVMQDEDVVRGRVQYPIRARRAGIEGRVIVRMMVDEAGRPVEPVVVKGIGFGCDEEVLRVLEDAMFEPAQFDGEPVKSWYLFTLVYSLS
ncbi:MAG: TonB family protein [Rhodothermales bacterium]